METPLLDRAQELSAMSKDALALYALALERDLRGFAERTLNRINAPHFSYVRKDAIRDEAAALLAKLNGGTK